MRVVRFLLGAAIGWCIFEMAVGLVGGIMAAQTVPREYFAYFGKANAGLALGLLNVGTWMLPVGATVFLASAATLRLAAPTWKPVALGLFVGLLITHLSYHVGGPIPWFGGIEEGSVLRQFLASLLPPWWSLPNLVAPWLGLLGAVKFTSLKFASAPGTDA